MTSPLVALWTRIPVAVLLASGLFLGCGSETAPTAAGQDPIAPVARMDMDSLCKTARSLDSSGRSGATAAALVLRSCLERLQGGWVLDSSALPDLEVALDSAVATYPDTWRASARDRLRAVARIPRQLNFSLFWPKVAMGSNGESGVPSRPDGIGAPFEDGGEEIWLATQWQANRLVQTYQAADGQRHDAYSLSADGRQLVLVATTNGDGMLRPLVIPMVFKKP
ncbi:MAG: hypothetical protein IPK50_02565 [Fibrobacterota bacterium]|nr:hypothetical protein [Fibrobacterota bacterium]QQS05779.1 MAG: hypothetical protein IPK50_02565 [Fibrobacterota bacterium]